MSILLITDTPGAEWAVHLAFKLAPYPVRTLAAQTKTDDWPPCLVAILDADGLDDPAGLVAALCQQQPGAVLLVATLSPTWKQSRAMFRAGASDYLLKTPGDPELIAACHQALDPI